MRPVAWSLVAACCALGAAGGCGSERAPFAGGGLPRVGEKDAGADGSLYIPPPPPPPPDAAGLCGNKFLPVEFERPNLYFILDASGSMRADIGGSTRYEAARRAIAGLLKSVGHRVSYGAAIFPVGAPQSDLECPIGKEVFSTRRGDDVSFAVSGQVGPVLTSLLTRLAAQAPEGLTPTAATLRLLHPTLTALQGKTYAFLLTDGGPNCNMDVPCSADYCGVNIEGGCSAPVGTSCCTPAFGYDYRWCLDAFPTELAVQALADAGVDTFIIGMPGSGFYASLLDRLAVAGNTARPTSPAYYPVTDGEDLEATLRKIGLAVATSCDIPLSEPPPDKGLVNVYLDDRVLPRDDQDGWTWVADDHLRIVGHSCELLTNGDIFQVQVVSGCPSITR